jgi:TonB family protein
MRKLTLALFFVFAFALGSIEAHSQVRLKSEEADKLLLEKTEPQFPFIAQMLKLQDTVTVDATVSESGTVLSATLLKGNEAFKVDAIKAVRKRKYKPLVIDGTPTRFITTVTIEFSLGIPKDQYDRDRKIAAEFFPRENQCRKLVNAGNYKDSEGICQEALKHAEMFPNGRELEKKGAYELVGHVMLGQKRYREALDYFKRAQVAVGSKLSEKDAELGDLYGSMAIAHHLLRELDKAQELYLKAERVLQAAYDNMKGDENDRELEELRRGYIKRLRRLLEYHLLAAEDAGASSEVEVIKKLMKTLP